MQNTKRDGIRNNESYDKFVKNYENGREVMLKAVALDEELKKRNQSSKELKIKTAELYKDGRSFFKKANEVNMMDIPTEHRHDVSENKKRIEGYDKCAQERILAICNELGLRNETPANTRAQTAALPRTRPTYTARSSSDSANRRAANKENVVGIRKKSVSPSRPTPTGRHSKLAKADLLSPSPRVSASTNQPRQARPGTSSVPAVNRAALLKGVDQKIGDHLLDEVLSNTGVTMKDVSGCESAKRALEEAVILPALNPSLFSGLRQPVKGILLFGPPGNGKTLLAKAVAGESNQMFFNISASSLTSKWVGDAEKTIRGLFQIARNAQPAIIFIDEIDSILCERNEKDSEVSRRMKTEFLVQFDGATGSADDRILVIGATNRPHELDDAVLRRFPKRILLSLPDETARFQLVKSTLKRHDMLGNLSDRDLKYIASCTSGYSNADLVDLCREASMEPVRSLDKSALANADRNKLRSLRASDFETALQTIKPSTSPKLMDRLVEFAKRCGQTSI